MTTVAKKRIFYVDSSQRNSGTSSAFSITLQVPANEDYNRIVVLECVIPISYYLVPSGYNTFSLKEGNTSVLISVPSGNYNINSFCSVVGTLLTQNSPNTWTYALAYNNGYTSNFNGLITYTVSGNNSQPSFIFYGTNYLNEQFGFNQGSTVQFSGSSLTSVNVVNFINEPVLFIHSDLSDNGNNDVLQGVYQGNASQLSTISYQATEGLLHAKNLKASKNLVANFYITDVDDFPINLNGQDWTMTLMLYKEDDFMKRFLKTLIENSG